MTYHQPTTLNEAFSALASGASVIAGGTDWYPSRGDAPLPSDILDITRLPQFAGISRENDGWRIGAATKWSEIARANLPPAFDGLRAAAREVGSLQIQNAGTIGGNLCNASPAADGVPALLTLESSVRLISDRGLRDMPLGDFIMGPRQTARAEDELLESLWIPNAPNMVSAFEKLGARKYLVISIAMIAVVTGFENDRLVDPRISVGACGPVARRLTTLEAALQDQKITAIADIIAQNGLTELSPISDVRGTAEYRRDVVRDMILRALNTACRGSYE